MKAFEPTPAETLALIETVSRTHFRRHRTGWIAAVFARVQDLFEGRYPGYQACDLHFHDFAHTCEVTAALARILDGNLARNPTLKIHPRDYDLAIAAALLHDAGYIKETSDRRGTGAKLTPIHVVRGSEFSKRFLEEFSIEPADIDIVRRTILWTGVNIDFDALECRNEVERLLGCSLGTADLLGQMAAPSYPGRLTYLHEEFREADAHNPNGKATYLYPTLADLLRQTRSFYDNYVMPVLENAYRGSFHDLAWHFPDRKNHYLLRIEKNLEIIDGMIPVLAGK